MVKIPAFSECVVKTKLEYGKDAAIPKDLPGKRGVFSVIVNKFD